MAEKQFIFAPWLRKLLALERVALLRSAFITEGEQVLSPVRAPLIFIALLITLIPSIAHIPAVAREIGENAFVLTGCALVLAIVVRNLAQLKFETVVNWKTSFSITHTAFGLGCIPAAIILCISPESVASLPQGSGDQSVTVNSNITAVKFVLSVSLWAALTEEFIYRGLLVSFLRRLPVKLSQFRKDILSVFLSGAIFGAAHLATWGFTLSLAVAGLGLGFGVAYVANGERLTPLIAYHALFDICSLTAVILLRS